MHHGRPSREENPLATARVIHFVGIGGIGMSALAELLISEGRSVTGSDVASSPVVERLTSLGARVNVGHTGEAVVGADLVVVTSAVRAGNPEVAAARRLGIPVVKRAELLGWLMNERYGLAVAGTHGKTTTTGMVAFLLHRAGMDPTVILGGRPLDFESHGLLGRSRYLVAEADEFDRSFLQLWPRVAVITSVEADHLDCYADLDEIARAFREFATRVPADGLLVTCSDDPILAQMQVPVPRQSYGFAAGAEWRITECEALAPFGTRFGFVAPSGATHQCRLRLSGRHYALDALAAIAVASHVGIEVGWAASMLGEFRGTRRRFELVGEAAGVTIVDDYAHHPTEVLGTLSAARERHRGRIWCVFQPHTANRTEKLLDRFAAAFADADRALLLPIYHPAGRRERGPTVSSLDLLARMSHPDARHARGLRHAVAMLDREVSPGDMVITMGAGDVHRVGEELLARLRARARAGDGG